MSMSMIRDKKLKEAAEMGEGIAREFNPETNIPFPFEEIVKRHRDLELRSGDLSNAGSPISNDLSGLILYDDSEKKFVILIEESKPKNRKYFTIAHELGHYFLHKEDLKEKSLVVDGDATLYRLDNGLSNIQESQANYFAASLLMPEDRVRKAWKAFNEDVEKCAELFDVSLSAMSIRVDILDLKYEYEDRR